jgi:threonine dehydrogenase-like Zn-dependent dehydrogenase
LPKPDEKVLVIGAGTIFDLAACLLEHKKIDVRGLITHRFAMGDYKTAVKTFMAKGKTGAIKIVLEHP